MSAPDRLSDLAGRRPERADGHSTHRNLIAAVQRWVAEHGAAPDRLAQVAEAAGVSTATAYRHFASVDDVIAAFVLDLPTRAVELFDQRGGRAGDSYQVFDRWNRAWVDSCLEHGPLAVHLRSPIGFLERRELGDPIIAFACEQIEPLLEPLGGDPLLMLFVWNITSDPREVLDLQKLGWDAERIAVFVSDSVLAVRAGQSADRSR